MDLSSNKNITKTETFRKWAKNLANRNNVSLKIASRLLEIELFKERGDIAKKLERKSGGKKPKINPKQRRR